MQLAFFRIPVNESSEAAAELNRFLRSTRILTVHREFVAQGENSFWALVVEYLVGDPASTEKASGPKRNKVDYREVLEPADFALYARLREWRKTIAEDGAVPVYTIFTNEQLAEIARRRCSTETALIEIEGVGPGRIEKYAQEVLKQVAQWGCDEAGE